MATVTADLRRESIDNLGVGGEFNEKPSASNFVDEAGVEMQRLDQDSRKSGDGIVLQNGHSNNNDKRQGRFWKKRSGLFPENYRKIQNYCFRFLEMPRGFLSISYHALLFILVIASLVLTVLSTVHTKDKNFEVILYTPILTVEIILIIIFVVEYIIRLWAAGCRSAYVGIKGRLRFTVKPYSIIDMVVIVSSIVAVAMASNMSNSSVRLLRFLPLLRVLRFDRQGGTWKLLGSVIFVHRQELLTTFYLGFISLIVASFVLFMAEKDINEDFESWPSSFWWGIVTLTTVGYGDAVPTTWYGKMCASLFALCGISFFALPAGILGSGFALKVTQQQRQKHFHRRRRPAAILLQSYWRLYCADLNSKSVATWLPSIYYNRQQHLLKNVLEKTGTTGTALGDNSPELNDSRKRKRSMWSKQQRGLRRGSYDVLAGRPESLAGNLPRKSSTCSALDSDFFDGRPRHGLFSSHDALVTMLSSHNIPCSIVHPLKESNPGSLWGDENIMLTLQHDGEMPCIVLSNAQKLAIRLIRILKLRVAIRKFKEARRPYDVKDVIEQYSTGHVEMLARVKNLQAKMDKAFSSRIEDGGGENGGKMAITSRLARVEQQVSVMDSKLETVLRILQNMQDTRNCPSGGSNSYDLFRGNADGVSSRRSSVSRAHSDPLDMRTQMDLDTTRVTTHVTRASDIPCVTLSDPETVQSSLSVYDRSQGSRPVSESSLHGSLSGGEHHSVAQLEGMYVSDVGTLNAPSLSRILVPDKRQLSDVTEESLTGSKETVGGLTPPGPISQQNSTASDTDPVPGGAESELGPGEVETEPGPGDIEVVWEKQEQVSKSPRRKRSQLGLDEPVETTLLDDKATWEQSSPFSTSDDEASGKQNIVERYKGTPERRTPVNGQRSTARRGSPVSSEKDNASREVEAGHFDESARSAPTRMSAKRRPLVKSNPVDV